MRVAGVVLAALAFVPSAFAGPLQVRATFDDRAVEFGAPIRTHVVALFDPDQVRAGSVHVVDDFAPLTALAPAHTTRADGVVAIDRTATCMTEPCLETVKLHHVTVTAVSRSGRVIHATAPWPSLSVRGRVTAADLRHARPSFLANTAPHPVSYRFAPATLERLLIVAAIALALGATALAAFELRARLRRRRDVVTVDELARALRLVREAEARPPADRRRALGLLARLLEARDRGLAGAANTLAWARPAPETTAVEELVENVEQRA